MFIAGISAVCLVTWRLNESILDQRRLAEARLDRERSIVETLNAMGKFVAGELDLDRAVQRVTDAATQLSSAALGAFFYKMLERSATRGFADVEDQAHARTDSGHG